eukprot:141475-Pelagomonas_calceolata.AAC.1
MNLRPHSAKTSALLCSTSKFLSRQSKNIASRPGEQRSVKMSAKVASPYLPDAPTDDKLPPIAKVSTPWCCEY